MVSLKTEGREKVRDLYKIRKSGKLLFLTSRVKGKQRQVKEGI